MPANTRSAILVGLISAIAGFALFQLLGSNLGRGPGIIQTEIDGAPAEPRVAAIDIPLADVPLLDLQGEFHSLGDWKQEVLVVNFWAPWCVPCRHEVPDLIALQTEYGERIQVLGLALDGVENITAFAEDYGINYPSFLAGQYIPMYNSVFGNQSGALPFTAIIDRERKIDYTHTGIVDLKTLRERISMLLSTDS